MAEEKNYNFTWSTASEINYNFTWSTASEINFIKTVGVHCETRKLSHAQHVRNYAKAIKYRVKWDNLDRVAILNALELELTRTQ